MNLLSDILAPEVLHRRVPRLAEVAEASQEYRNLRETVDTLGKYTKVGGFDPSRRFQYVAQIPSSVWSAVVEVFGKTDPETGELMDDGLLYITNERGQIVLNKDFFMALLSGPLAQFDMRTKIVV